MLQITCPTHGLCEGLETSQGTFCQKCLEEKLEEQKGTETNGQEDF